MALAIVHSRALEGVQAPAVTVEVHLTGGLPSFTLVGLPDTEVKEARDRVRAALLSSGFEFPQKRITANLAPADLPKESGRFDLPIALGILAASGQIPISSLEAYEFVGELSLSGGLRAVRGTLAMALSCADVGRAFILPLESAREAALGGNLSVFGAESLLEVCAHLVGQTTLAEVAMEMAVPHLNYPDLLEVRGQLQAKRALEIAAAGEHSLLMMGPPGTGKSMLASRLPGIMPALERSAARDSAAMLSLVGKFFPETFGTRPFRSPHHTASAVALVGGGNPPRPGEISLAHRGVLFLDELPEFDRKVLEALREPLETGCIHIARAARQAVFPARFQLVAAMNPCPCGFRGDASGRCRCTPDQVARYRGKLSGPFIDRVDLLVEVPLVPPETIQQAPDGEPSSSIRASTTAALELQHRRQGKVNALLTATEVDLHCQPDDSGVALLNQVANRFGFSARAIHRILRVSRSIADLAGCTRVETPHIAEAVQFRRLATLQ